MIKVIVPFQRKAENFKYYTQGVTASLSKKEEAFYVKNGFAEYVGEPVKGAPRTNKKETAKQPRQSKKETK